MIKIMKILIGYDGSECADAALTDLQRAGLPHEAEVLILSAADVFLSPETQSDTDDVEAFPLYVPHGIKLARERAARVFFEAEKFAAAAAQKIREMFPLWQVTAEAVADTPHRAIIARAEEWKPDLAVVGSQGRSALGRFILGSVSQKVLYESSCSVRISRGRILPADRPAKLILGTDGSPDADAMIEAVAARNWGKGTQIKLVTAVEAFHQYALEPDVQLDRIRDIQMMAIEKLNRAGLEGQAVLTDEDPKKYLVRQAKKWEADCIFLGAKGHSFFERILIGSVSSSVAAHADCSVEVIRIGQK